MPLRTRDNSPTRPAANSAARAAVFAAAAAWEPQNRRTFIARVVTRHRKTKTDRLVIASVAQFKAGCMRRCDASCHTPARLPQPLLVQPRLQLAAHPPAERRRYLGLRHEDAGLFVASTPRRAVAPLSLSQHCDQLCPKRVSSAQRQLPRAASLLQMGPPSYGTAAAACNALQGRVELRNSELTGVQTQTGNARQRCGGVCY